MSRIFISHNSNDAREAVAIKQWLTENGWDDVFLDIDTKDGLTPGERWKNALTNAVDQCEAVLCLISPEWLSSPECKLEYRFAETLRKHLFLVLLKPCNPQDLPTDWQWCPLYGIGHQTVICIDFHGQSAECRFLSEGLARLKNGLIKSGISAEHFLWPPEKELNRAPYRGLNPLEADDAAIFFGRNTQILHGMETMRDMRRSGVERLLVILGASGSGKSSFMRAGLLPRLTRDNHLFFPLQVIRPRNAVITGEDGLAVALFKACTELGRKITLGKIERELISKPHAFHTLLIDLEHRLRERATNGVDASPPSIVIAIDQAEELFNPDGSAEAAYFLNLLSGELAKTHLTGEPITQSETTTRFIVVLTIRSDRYERLQTASVLSGIQSRLLDLKPLPHTQFERVINGPAERATQSGRKLIIDSRLTDRLLADFSEGADTLPLLGFTLEKLYHKYGSDGDLMLEEYEYIRGRYDTVQAAIFQEAIDTALKEPYRSPAIPAEQAEQYRGLRRTFIPFLVRINPENNEPLRQMAKLGGLPAEIHPFIDRLVEVRLLIKDKNVIEVAHESLLRQWQSLSEWLKEDVDKLRLLGNIRYSAAEWKKSGQRDDLLVHRNGRLKEAEDLLSKSGYEVSDESDERVYLSACTAAQQARETAEKQEQERRIRDAERIAEEEKKAASAAEAARGLEEEARVQAERFAKRSRTQKWFAIMIAVLALYASYAANRSANEATKQLIATEAAILWHPLDFSERVLDWGQLKGLLQLAQSDEARKYAFFEQLLQDETLAERFIHQSNLIINAAVGLNLEQRNRFLDHLYQVAPEKETNKIFRVARMLALLELGGEITQEGMIAAIQATHDPDQLKVFSQSAAALPIKLTELQVSEAANKFVTAIQASDDPNQLEALSHGLETLPIILSEAQASAVVDKFVDAIKVTNELDRLRLKALGQGMVTVSAKMPETQIGSVADKLVDAIKATKNLYQLDVFNQVVMALTTKMPEAQAGAVADKFVNMILATDDSAQRRVLGLGIVNMAFKVPETQISARADRLVGAILATYTIHQPALGQGMSALAAKVPEEQAGVVANKFVDLIKVAEHPYQLEALGQFLAALPVKLTEMQVGVVIDKFLGAIKAMDIEYQLKALGQGVATLAAKVPETQIGVVVDKLLNEIKVTEDPYQLGALGQFLAAQPVKLTETQVDAIADKFLGTIKATDIEYQLEVLGQGVSALAAKVPEEQVGMVANKFLAAILATDDLNQLKVFVKFITMLPVKLIEAQVGTVVDKLVDAKKTTRDPYQLDVLGQGVSALAVKVSEVQAELLIKKFVAEILITHDPNQLKAFAKFISVLPVKLTEAQVGAVIDKFLEMIKTKGFSYQLEVLGQGLSALAVKVPGAQAGLLVNKFVAAILTTHDPNQLEAFVKFISVLPVKLTEAQVDVVADKFLGAIKATEHPHELQSLGQGVSALVVNVPEAWIGAMIDKFVDAIKATSISYQLEALGQGVLALAAKVPEEQAGVVANTFVAAILGADNPDQYKILSQGVVVLDVMVSDTQVDALVDKFLGAIKTTSNLNQLEAFSHGVMSLSIKLTEMRVNVVFDKFVTVILATDDLVQLKTLSQGLAVLINYINHDDYAASQLFEVLKNPLIPRETITDAIRKRCLDAPPAEQGFWPLIKWADKRFPHLDLRSPLKKPV